MLTKLCCSLFGLLVALMVSAWLILPIIELHFGTKYSGQDICNSTIPITIPQWLIVSGVNGVVYVFYLCLTLCALPALLYDCGVGCSICLVGFGCSISLISITFNIAWNIIGSIIFWKDCINLQPKELNIMMWCALFINYGLICIAIKNARTMIFRYQTLKREKHSDNVNLNIVIC